MQRFVLAAGIVIIALALWLLPEMSAGLERQPDEAWARVRQTGVIRFAINPTYMPFDGMGSQGESFGIDVDLANELARRLGKRVEYVVAGYDSLYDVLRVGQAEATISALPPPSRYSRPTMKQIKEKYPDLFKTFPEIKTALFKEQAYSDVFPTVDDAKESLEKAQAFDEVQADLMRGDSTRLVQALNEISPKVAKQFVDKLIPSIYNVDQRLYYGLVTPIVQKFIRAMFEEGKKSGDENKQAAAFLASQFAGFDESTLTGAVA